MSSFTFADNRLGGRFTAAADAIAAGKLRTAAGILMEVANELYVEADSTDGLMADALVVPDLPIEAVQQAPADVKPPNAMDLQSCARGAHSFPQVPDSRGWFTCLSCGYVVVTPPGDGTMGVRL